MAGDFSQWLGEQARRGWATLAAEFRRGLKDLQNVVLNAWNGVVATHEESGTIANPTQQLVTQDIQGKQSYGEMLERYGGRSAYEPQQPAVTQQREQDQEREP